MIRPGGFRWLVFLVLLLGGAPGVAQERVRLEISVAGAGGGWRPEIRVAHLFDDPALAKALDSGLPLRLHLRMELWRKGFFDRLVGADDVQLALLEDPLDRTLLVETDAARARYPTASAAEGAIGAAFRSRLEPDGRGRYYYLAHLDVETLSLSDLDELRRWLRGEVGPAIQGRGSPGRAVERGLRRVFVRVIGLPTRSVETRSATFIVR